MKTSRIPARPKYDAIVAGPIDAAVDAMAKYVGQTRWKKVRFVNGYGAIHMSLCADAAEMRAWFADTHLGEPGALLFYGLPESGPS